MRRLLTATTATLLTLTLAPAQAAPVTTGRVAMVAFTVQESAAAQLRVELWAMSTNRVEVSVSQCGHEGCDYPVYYAGEVPAGSATIDPSTAKAAFKAVLGGLPVAATWSPGPSGTVVVSTGHGGGGDESGAAFTATRVDPAVAHLSVGKRSCDGTGEVGDVVHAELPDGSAGDTAALSDLRLPTGSLGCAT
jgi:hypothetical protein